VLRTIEGIKTQFNAEQNGKQVSLADLIVLGGCAAIEAAAKKAGHEITVPFTPGRTDADAQQTDSESFAVLEPLADPFRNYVRKGFEARASELLLDKASLLTLTAPETTVLLGGLRALQATASDARHGVFTARDGALTNDFFLNLLDMRTAWRRSERDEHVFEGRDRTTGAIKWTATVMDLIFGSNAQLRAICEVYASRDADAVFVADFVHAWNKVMNLDRFDVRCNKAR